MRSAPQARRRRAAPTPVVAELARRRGCGGSSGAAWCCSCSGCASLAATERFSRTLAPPEPPLQSYAASPAPRIAEGLAITRQCARATSRGAAAAPARATAIVLMPARFQVDDADYGRLKEAVAAAGGELRARRRDRAVRRGARAAWQLPRLDLLPALRRALPGPDLFFQETVHLTPRGHAVVAEALDRFIEDHRLLDRADRARLIVAWSSTPSTSSGSSSSSTRSTGCCRTARRTGCCWSPATTSTRRGTGASSAC